MFFWGASGAVCRTMERLAARRDGGEEWCSGERLGERDGQRGGRKWREALWGDVRKVRKTDGGQKSF